MLVEKPELVGGSFVAHLLCAFEVSDCILWLGRVVIACMNLQESETDMPLRHELSVLLRMAKLLYEQLVKGSCSLVVSALLFLVSGLI